MTASRLAAQPPTGIAITGRPPHVFDLPLAEPMADPGGRARRRALVRAEVRCHLCGELRGVLERSLEPGDPSPARLLSVDGAPGSQVTWASLRCLRCGSRSLYLDEHETVVDRVEPVDWSLDRPRRGRPPRWLVTLRAQRDAA